MIKKILFLMLLLPLLPATLHAEASQRGEFYRHLNQGDGEQALAVLEGWSYSDPEDPELYVGYSNFHLMRAQGRLQSGFSEANSPSVFDFLRPSTKNDAPAAGEGQPALDMAEFNLALDYLDQALDKQPTRSDIYFTKIGLLQQVGRHDEVSSCLLRLLDAARDQFATWYKDYRTELRQPLDKELAPKVQDILFKLTSSRVPQATDIVVSVSRKMVEIFPGSTYGYTNLAEYYKAQQDTGSALSMYQQAEAADPTNSAILTNIIELSISAGDTTTAIAYLEKLRDTGSSRDRDYAEDKLMQLTR